NNNGIPDLCELMQLNKALQFDGVNDYGSAGTATVFNMTNGLTIEAWVRPDSISSYHVIVSKGIANATAYGFITPYSNLGFVAYTREDYFTSNVYFAPGVWNHVATTFDASNNAHSYVNGQFVETVTGSSPATISANPLLIGRTSPTTGEYWAGAIDEVRIWS